MRSALADAIRALAVVVLWLGAIELSMAALHVPVSGSNTMRDAQRSFRFRPNARFWFETEGWNLVRVNSHGFEDVERPIQRRPGTLRLAFLGSSTVQSPQVQPEDAFPAVVARELKKWGQVRAREVEGLNFGVGGYGLPQQWITLRDEVWKYDPQIVIEVVNLYNDLVNNDRYTTVSGRTYPYYTVRNGQLIPDEMTVAQQRPPDPERVKWENRLGDLMNRSKLLLLVNRAYRVRLMPAEWQPGLRIDGDQVSTFFPPRDPHLANAWEVTEATLKLMRDECLAHHAEFWVVTPDFNIQSDPDPTRRAEHLRKFGITDPDYPDRRIIEFARKEGIHSFWLAPLLADYAESHHAALHGFFNTPENFGHYNAYGHQVVGKFIAGELAANSDILKAAVN